MDLLGALGILVRVVETDSFSAVARERELSQAAVARQISWLEEHFGVRLLHRTTRKLSLNDDGQMPARFGPANTGRRQGDGNGCRAAGRLARVTSQFCEQNGRICRDDAMLL
jgi:Bacterial regulatory helix-turn-helix protein, lysR family